MEDKATAATARLPLSRDPKAIDEGIAGLHILSKKYEPYLRFIENTAAGTPLTALIQRNTIMKADTVRAFNSTEKGFSISLPVESYTRRRCLKLRSYDCWINFLNSTKIKLYERPFAEVANVLVITEDESPCSLAVYSEDGMRVYVSLDNNRAAGDADSVVVSTLQHYSFFLIQMPPMNQRETADLDDMKDRFGCQLLMDSLIAPVLRLYYSSSAQCISSPSSKTVMIGLAAMCMKVNVLDDEKVDALLDELFRLIDGSIYGDNQPVTFTDIALFSYFPEILMYKSIAMMFASTTEPLAEQQQQHQHQQEKKGGWAEGNDHRCFRVACALLGFRRVGESFNTQHQRRWWWEHQCGIDFFVLIKRIVNGDDTSASSLTVADAELRVDDLLQLLRTVQSFSTHLLLSFLEFIVFYCYLSHHEPFADAYLSLFVKTCNVFVQEGGMHRVSEVYVVLTDLLRHVDILVEGMSLHITHTRSSANVDAMIKTGGLVSAAKIDSSFLYGLSGELPQKAPQSKLYVDSFRAQVFSYIINLTNVGQKNVECEDNSQARAQLAKVMLKKFLYNLRDICDVKAAAVVGGHEPEDEEETKAPAMTPHMEGTVSSLPCSQLRLHLDPADLRDFHSRITKALGRIDDSE